MPAQAYEWMYAVLRENNIIQIDLPDGSPDHFAPCPWHVYVGDVWGSRCPDSLNCFY